MIQVKDREFVLYLREEEIREKVARLGEKIGEDYRDTYPLLLGVLNGAFIFLADLAKNIQIPVEITFIKIASYESTSSSGKVKQLMGLDTNIKGRDVIIVEDIIDTGLSMAYLIKEIKKQDPKSIAVASLLFKPDALKEKVTIKYVGFEIPDKFVVGYGLDYNGAGRNLREIYQLK